MGATKTEHHDTALLELAELAKALGHPLRMQIFLDLLKETKLTQSGITKKSMLKASTVSEHLSKMKKAKIIISVFENGGYRIKLDKEKISFLTHTIYLKTGRDISIETFVNLFETSHTQLEINSKKQNQFKQIPSLL